MNNPKPPMNTKVFVVIALIFVALFVLALMPQRFWVDMSMKYFH